jgi:hypothetical protein
MPGATDSDSPSPPKVTDLERIWLKKSKLKKKSRAAFEKVHGRKRRTDMAGAEKAARAFIKSAPANDEELAVMKNFSEKGWASIWRRTEKMDRKSITVEEFPIYCALASSRVLSWTGGREPRGADADSSASSDGLGTSAKKSSRPRSLPAGRLQIMEGSGSFGMDYSTESDTGSSLCSYSDGDRQMEYLSALEKMAQNYELWSQTLSAGSAGSKGSAGGTSRSGRVGSDY